MTLPVSGAIRTVLNRDAVKLLLKVFQKDKNYLEQNTGNNFLLTCFLHKCTKNDVLLQLSHKVCMNS